MAGRYHACSGDLVARFPKVGLPSEGDGAQRLDWELCLRLAEAANCRLVLKHSLLLAEETLGLELWR